MAYAEKSEGTPRSVFFNAFQSHPAIHLIGLNQRKQPATSKVNN